MADNTSLAGNTTTTSVTGVLENLASNLDKIIIFTVILAIGVFFAVLVKILMKRSLYHRLPRHVYKPLESIVYYSLIILAGVGALSVFNVSLTSLIIAGGFAGIVVGLAAQSTLGNLISGLIILIEQPLRIGDPINISNYSGIVTEINVFSTVIRSWDGPIVRIPNNDVFNSVIINYSRMKARRVDLIFGIRFDKDLKRAMETVKGLIEEHQYCLVNPKPLIFADSYADGVIQVKAWCWAPLDVWFDALLDLKNKLKESLEKAGIQVSYPQLDVHIDQGVRLELDKSSFEKK